MDSPGRRTNMAARLPGGGGGTVGDIAGGGANEPRRCEERRTEGSPGVLSLFGSSPDFNLPTSFFLWDLVLLMVVVGMVLEAVGVATLSFHCLLYLRKRRNDFGGGWSSSLSGGKSPFLHVYSTQRGVAKL